MSLRQISVRSMSSTGRMVAAVAMAAMVLSPVMSEARPGGGKSSGSRGSQTNAAPPSTSTAPGAAQPMQRSMTPNTGAPATAARPAVPAAGAAAAAAQAAKPSFARTMMMGLGAGLLGAGLFGLLSGSGLFGGLGGIASFLGLILQAALIAGVIYLAIRFFRRRREEAAAPAMAAAGVGAGMMPNMDNMNREAHQPQAMAVAATPVSAMEAPALQPLELTEGDFGIFEKRLQGVMAAYSSEDLAALRSIATPEMVGYFAEDIAENARKGVIDVSKDVKLVKGDLAESWREGQDEYATVAMRFSMINTISERGTGKIIEGHATVPHEATEIWTFLRQPGGQSNGEWLLSAIQQTT